MSYKPIKGTDRRACVRKSFGFPDIIFCSCNVEEAQECKDNYDRYKIENYNSQKGQEVFTNASRKT